MDSNHLAQVAILVQTITSEHSSGLDAVVFIHWFCLVMSCWLGTVSLTINLIVPPLTNPRKCWSLPVPPPISREEIVLVLFPWWSMTDHPRSLPASPEASGVDDVVRRCPPQGAQTDSELSTIFSVAPYALKVLWSEGTLAAWPQPPYLCLSVKGKLVGLYCCFHLSPVTPPATPLMLQTMVTRALSRMVMLLRDWAYDYLGRHVRMEFCELA